jgi:hypothetical protein
MLEHLRDDLALQLAVYAGDADYGEPGRIDELDRPKIERLAELLDFPFDWGADADQRRQAAMLLAYALKDPLLELLDPKPLPYSG